MFTVVKEPPFSIKESGYAGFTFPIEIYLKNKDEPKKIKFSYDFTLQQSGILRDRYIFKNPNDEFRKKLLKGGGMPITDNTFYTNPDQETRSRDSFTEDKQLISKPKLSTENIKKHKVKEHKEEIPLRTNSFENLFGAPIQKPPKVSPDPKKIDRSTPSLKSEKKDKDRSSSDKKSKHDHKEAKVDKVKVKEEKDKIRSDKIKAQIKETEKSKDKPSKRTNERPATPESAKKRCLSPVRRINTSPPRSNSASSNKEEYKTLKNNLELSEQKKQKIEEKPPEVKIEKDAKEKKKKEKKSHDRDKERKEKREHKKENHKIKELSKEIQKDVPKIKETPKEKEPVKETVPMKEKQPKLDKPANKFSIENLRKTPDNEERTDSHKHKDKIEPEKKHKQKKKDKKRDESREKHKESNKEKKHKIDKIRDLPVEKPEIIEIREPLIPKERPILEPTSPISIDTASQCSSKSGFTKPSHVGTEDIISSHSDSESSMIVEDEESKVKLENPSPEPVKHEPSSEPEPEVEPPRVVEAAPPQAKEKTKKRKDKSKKEEKRRKRKAAEMEDTENRNTTKSPESGPSYSENRRSESNGFMSAETKVQDNGVSSSLGEDAEPGDLSPDYMVRLRDLQQRIMKIKNNADLERVVNLIAETGRYEVTTQTFDFDLCLLDRSTVQQLIQLVGC